jgi:hypothetical protein
MKADEICARAARLVGGEREQQHGPKLQNHSNIAVLWDAYFDMRTANDPAGEITAHDVALMMVLLKIARTMSGEFNADDYIDMAGYAGVAAEIASQTEPEVPNARAVR